jgi:hypothetical protein
MYVLHHSGLLSAPLFSDTLLIDPLPTHVESIALSAHFSFFILAQLSSVASTGIEFRVNRDELG